MRGRRAFSLVEIVIVFVLVAVLSAVAAAGLRSIQRESRSRTARAALETVAGAQETYHLDRGRWGTSPDAFAAFSAGGLTVADAASTGPTVVSADEVNFDGHAALGLAVLDGNADCLTLVVLPPTVGGTAQIQRRPGSTCDGSLAVLP